jgi:hypothetical protein
MRYILLLLASLAICLASCAVMLKDKAEIEKISEDIIEEIAEDSI